MEIVNIEAKALKEMNVAFQAFKQEVYTMCQRNAGTDRLDEWLDNQEVCILLNISPRTLQSLRSNGTLAYTQIERRVYYKKQDVVQLLEATGVRPGGKEGV